MNENDIEFDLPNAWVFKDENQHVLRLLSAEIRMQLERDLNRACEKHIKNLLK